MKKIKKTDIALIVGVIAIIIIGFFAASGSSKKIEKPVTVTGEPGVQEINYKEYEELINKEEPFVIMIGSATCSHCITFKPVMEEVSTKNNIPVKYIDINNLSEEEGEKFSSSNNYLKKTQWGTPTTLVLQGKDVVGSLSGETEADTLLEFLNKNVKVKAE